MKKLFYLPLVLGAMAVAFTSCQTTEDDPAEIRADRTILEFPYDGGSATLTLTASETWTISIVGIQATDWGIRLIGSADATQGSLLTVYIDSINSSHLARTAPLRFTLTATGASVEVELFQEGNPTGIANIEGPWSLDFWAFDDASQEFVEDSELDTISRNRYDARQFHIFRAWGQPQPVIQWDGANFIYITKRLPDLDNRPFWQAPFAVIDDGAYTGEVFRISDSLARLSFSQNMLVGDPVIHLTIGGVSYPAFLLLATMDRDPNAAGFRIPEDLIDPIGAPIFTRGNPTSGNAPRRTAAQRGDVSGGVTIEVSLDDRVGNIRDFQPRRR